jgi:hypothetical protein
MERLTAWDKDRVYLKNMPQVEIGGDVNIILVEAVKRLAGYEDMMERWGFQSTRDIDTILHRVNALGGTDKMADYKRAEEQGRLIMLPCKVGDTVYCTIYDEYGIAPIDKGTVYAVSINGQTNWFSVQYKSGLRYDYTWDDLGKTVFLTREEAEKELEKNELDN